jgi:hypothetical protein
MDMDDHQQTSIIHGAPFLRSVKADINERKGIINMRVEGKHEKFIVHPKSPAYLYQVRVHHQKGSNKVEYVEVLPYEPECLKWNDSSQSKGSKNAKTPGKKADAAKYSKQKYICYVKNAISTMPPSLDASTK